MDIDPLIQEIDRYAEETGLKPETVVRRATDNPRLYTRLPKQAERLTEAAVKIRAYMQANPPKGAVSSE